MLVFSKGLTEGVTLPGSWIISTQKNIISDLLLRFNHSRSFASFSVPNKENWEFILESMEGC